MSSFKVKVRTKNNSAEGLKDKLVAPCRTVFRLGSTTPTEIIFPRGIRIKQPIIEINSVEGVQNSRSKLRMKECFSTAEVSQSYWWDSEQSLAQDSEIKYPILSKRVYGFKGRGMQKLDDRSQLEQWLNSHPNTDGWYFEEFKKYSREYRLHVSRFGCFYTCRKMLKSDATSRWFRNDSNCVWMLESNELFDKPVNWEQIENDCVRALDACKLDVGAFDVKIQSAKNNSGRVRENPEYIIIEVNSAPAFGELTTQKYLEEIPRIIEYKYESGKFY